MTRHRNLPLLLLQAREAAMVHFRPILKQFGLTDQQWRIVRALADAPDGLEPGRIADVCMILPPSLTGILTRMTQMELVKRERSEVDQRRQRISLTAKGRELVDRALPLVERQYRMVEAVVGKGVLASTYEALDDMLALLSRPIPSAVSQVPRPVRAPRRK